MKRAGAKIEQGERSEQSIKGIGNIGRHARAKYWERRKEANEK